MIATRQSGAAEKNDRVTEHPRRPPRRRNRQWLAEALPDRDLSGWVLLLGGTAALDFRLRVAQSHARQDMLPSFWSHAAIIRGKAGDNDWNLSEVSLDPPQGFGFVPRRNGVQDAKLSRYDDARLYPNIACLHFPVKEATYRPEHDSFAAALEKAVATFQAQRGALDVGTQIVEWLGFVWGSGEKGNPLLKGVGIPSAAFVESAFSIAGVELTPGLSSQSSCPEAIWQAAVWWHPFYRSDAAATQEAPEGRYCLGQKAAAPLD
jgi:hypothetical protein